MGEYVVWKKCRKKMNRETVIESEYLELDETHKDYWVQLPTPLDSSQDTFSIILFAPHSCIIRRQIQKKKEVLLHKSTVV